MHFFHDVQDPSLGTGSDEQATACAVGFDEPGAVWTALPYRVVWPDRHILLDAAFHFGHQK
jgi:hypothetical protein